MNILPNTPNIDFLKQRKFWLGFSIVLTLVTIILPLVKKPNWGVDFAGGNEIQVQFTGDVDVGDVRRTIEGAGFNDANIQQFGDPSEHEFLVRVGRSSLYTNEEFASNVEPKLRQAFPQLAEGVNGLSYNADEGDQVMLTAKEGEQLSPESIRTTFDQLQIPTQDVRVITDGRQYSVMFKGVSNKVEQALQKEFPTLNPEVRRVEQVGASVGTELKISATKAMLLSLLLIMLYVGIRFDFAFGTGAIVSLIHDAIIVVFLYLLLGFELNTTTIAAVLTIIGYSVNDTVIIFDRVRENMTKHKGRGLYRLFNDSINETLSRTIITHVTVFLSLVGLMVFTAGTLREFAIAMALGVVTGSYSSMFIAAPIVIWVQDVMNARKERESNTQRIATVR